MGTYLTEILGVDPDTLDAYGVFDVSLVTDLPLFIDPFLLFGSEKEEYNRLHDKIIEYLVFLRDKALAGPVNEGLLATWYFFPEIKQNWLGFSLTDNGGRGLGMDFARALHASLSSIFSDFGSEAVTESSHLEKVCLIRDGVGRDSISDFTTNLIQDYLCAYSQTFALAHLTPQHRREVSVPKARFNRRTERWDAATYTLPWANSDYVILSPRDMLTRDDTWINKGDLVRRFDALPQAVPDEQLRAQISAHFHRCIVKHDDKEPTQKELDAAAAVTIAQFPVLIDYYIALKEGEREQAESVSSQKVGFAQQIFHTQIRALQQLLAATTPFYQTGRNTYEEAIVRTAFLKDVVENKGGHRIFYNAGIPIKREADLQVMYRLVWIGTPSDVSAEVNDGRGPADYKISRGASDKTIVEMKLASNSQLERNLTRQVEIYKAASDAKAGLKVILFFTAEEQVKVNRILKKLGIDGRPDIFLIDARSDNKPSGSQA
jgi:hypothetical protein